METLIGAPIPPEPSLSVLEMTLCFAAFGTLCIIAGCIVLYIEKKGRNRR